MRRTKAFYLGAPFVTMLALIRLHPCFLELVKYNQGRVEEIVEVQRMKCCIFLEPLKVLLVALPLT